MHPPVDLALELLGGCGAVDEYRLPPRSGASANTMKWLQDRQIDSLLHHRQEQVPEQQVRYDFVLATQRRWWVDALAALAAADVRTIVFKGAEFLERLFAPRALGITHDIDLLVGRSQLDEALEVLLALGFRQHVVRHDGTLRSRSAEELKGYYSRHYELAPLLLLHPIGDSWSGQVAWPMVEINGEVNLAVYADLHFGVATNVSGEQFFERAQTSAYGIAETMSDADHLWFLASRLYSEWAFHEKRSLRDLAYMASLVGKPTVSWEVVEESARRYALGPSLFHVLAFLEQLLRIKVPGEVLAACDPSARSYRRDAGAQVHHWFGLQSWDELQRLLAETPLGG